MKKLFISAWAVLMLLFLSIDTNSQQPIFAGNDTSICQGPVTLTATIDSSLFSGAGSPTFLSLSDDVFSGVMMYFLE